MGRKSRLTLADWSRIKSTPVENKSGYQTRKEFLEQEEQEQARIAASEERRRTAPLREAEQELREAAREASARIAMYWKIPIAEIQMNPVSITRVDIAGDYEIGPRDEPAENAAWKEFQENLKSFGCTLSDAGLLRLSHYLVSLNYHRGISLTSVSNFATALERLVSLNVFQPGELTGYQQTPTKTVEQPVTQPPAEQTLDELLETTSSETREGRAKIRDAVQRAAVHGEYHATWSAFEASLYANFSPTPENVAQGHKGFVMTPIQKQTFYDTMLRRGMNFHRPKDYDTVRVALCKSGDLPALLYPQERLEIEMEMSNLNDREVRRQFAQRSRELNTKSLI